MLSYCNEICILDFLQGFLIIINNLEKFIEYEYELLNMNLFSSNNWINDFFY